MIKKKKKWVKAHIQMFDICIADLRSGVDGTVGQDSRREYFGRLSTRAEGESSLMVNSCKSSVLTIA